MSEKLLLQILEELKSVKETQSFMQVQLKETNQIVSAIRDRQEETDAKLDNVTMDIHKIHGMVTTNTEKIGEMSEIINELKHIEHQQEETLNVLSRRSIDQEEKIRRIQQ